MSLERLLHAPELLGIARPSTPLANQVAGHQGVMSDESGGLVIKPALAREIAFYQLLKQTSKTEPLAQLRPFVPQFYGTLHMGGSATASVAGPETNEAESVVLENLAHDYTHPCILDAKLGTVLYSPEATEEKKARMDKQAKETTSHETGLRFTGCQTWHEPSQSFIVTPKSFGKGLPISQLPDGMVRFFPSPTDTVTSLNGQLVAGPTTSTIASASSSLGTMQPPHLPLAPDVPLQEVNLQPGAKAGDTAPQPPTEYRDHAISSANIARVLDLVDRHLEAIENVLKQLEIRFIGASVLVVYEGDPDRLQAALDRWDSVPDRPLDAKALNAHTDDYGDESESSSGDESDDELDGPAADAKSRSKCPPVTVRMIDFAHTRLAEGEGPDTGVLKGLATLRSLVQQRHRQLTAAHAD